MTPPPRRRDAILRFACGCGLAGAVWCGALPRLLTLGPVARHVARMEARAVDPAAMYYTELERLPLRPAWIDDVLILWP